MSRIPASAGIALVGLLPAYAAALGLGEVQSRSYLNQPFAAEIPIITDQPGELAGLSVALASQETFDQYGLAKPAFLADLTFNVVPGPQGGVIRINSANAVVEPFVTLLLEVRWPQGRLLREYTVLLDPPAFTEQAVRSPVPTPRSEPATATSAAPEPAGITGSGSTHVVQRNETLWGIAERYRPASGPGSTTDLNQMMLAIYRANPGAFAGNINRLNAGAALRLPGQDELGEMSSAAARAEVQRQTEAWRGEVGAASAARLELVPPGDAAPVPAGSTTPVTRPAPDAQQAEEARRLLAVKDAELQALRQRVAELERATGDVALEPEAAPAPDSAPGSSPEPQLPATETPPVEQATTPAAEEPAPAVAPPTADRRPASARPPAAKPAPAGGVLDTITGLLSNIWLWVVAAAVVIGALLVARRRAQTDEAPAWRPTPRRSSTDTGVVAATGDMVVEEAGKAQRTGGIERRETPRGDDELPLERTISTDGPVNLDQSDPLAEADFHMVYGLYDQAADLLSAAIARDPGRRDLQMKLMDVHFVWENRDGFLKEARALRQRIGNDADSDWKRVLIMGRQLCPNEALFAGGASTAAEDMDLALTDDGAGTVDVPIVEASGVGLDFDLADPDAATKVAERPWSPGAQTQEIRTIEAAAIDGASTMETPTVESPAYGASTMETPTIEANMGDRTMETPTLQSRTLELGRTARLPQAGGTDERGDQTAEIDLEDLGLDLTGLDDAAGDMATGLQEALPDSDGALDLDFSGDTLLADAQDPTNNTEKSPTLRNLTKAMGRDVGKADDTAEQPGLGDATQVSVALGDTSTELESLEVDLGFGSGEASDLTATGLRAIGSRRPEDPTMTEVGTKLDLARAYVDMGDPDGARSILNEVLEEGDPAQRQEARQLLDALGG
jgi:pilus assembly protein FimV